MTLTEKDLIVGHEYSARKPKNMMFGSDNRVIVWRSADGSSVQYDSDTVKIGRHLPTVPTEKFLKWVGKDESLTTSPQALPEERKP